MIVRNTLANLAGQLVYPLISLILVPFYIHFLGLEGYGLVGFFVLLIAILQVFTKGLGAALQREFAVRSASPDRGDSMLSLLRTFEVVYWMIGLLIAVGVVGFADWIGSEWLTVETLSRDVVSICMMLIAVRIALAFPAGVYQAVFVGTGRQVLGNGLTGGFAIGGAVTGAIVVWATRSVIGFYASEAVVAMLMIAATQHVARRAARRGEAKGRFEWSEVGELWKLSVSLMWSHGAGLILTQLDRIFISKLLPVASLGVYTAGSAPGRLLGMATTPYLTAVFPETCRLAEEKADAKMTEHLLYNSRLVALVAFAAAVPFSFFAHEILITWTRNATVAAEGSGVFAIYVWGNVFLALASVFYQGQLAMGIARYGAWFNSAALVWLPVVTWALVRRDGLDGAAWSWVLFCVLSWLSNLFVTLILLLRSGRLFGYLGSMTVIALPSLAAGYGADLIATRLFPASSAARLAIGIAAGAAILMFGYLILFGFRLPSLPGAESVGTGEPETQVFREIR